MGMSQSYGVADDGESLATIHRAIELGLDFFDTAEVYGPFINEELVGRALKASCPGSDRYKIRLPYRKLQNRRHR